MKTRKKGVCSACGEEGHNKNNQTLCKKHPKHKGKLNDSPSPTNNNTPDPTATTIPNPSTTNNDFLSDHTVTMNNVDPCQLVHFCFDIETTGVSHFKHEVIELFCQLLVGHNKQAGEVFTVSMNQRMDLETLMRFTGSKMMTTD